MSKKNKKRQKRSKSQHSPDFNKTNQRSVSLSGGKIFQLALHNFQVGNLLRSEEFCRQILHVDSDNADANHLLGVVYAQQGVKGDSAVQFIQKAIQSDPGNAEFHKNLGIIHMNSGKTDDAIASFKKALSIKRDYAEAYKNLVFLLAKSGKKDAAIACIKDFQPIYSDDAEAHNSFGLMLKDFDIMEEAVSSFRKAISLDSKYFMAHNNLGLALQELDRIDDAIVSFREALNINPDYATTHFNLGVAFLKQDMLEDSLASFQKAISLQADFADAYYNLGVVQQKLNTPDDAIASLRAAISLKPDFVEAYNVLGSVLHSLGKTKEAIAVFRKALNYKQESAEVHNNLGLALQDLNMVSAAVDSYQKALSIKPDYIEALNNLGLELQRSGKLQEALTYYRKALSHEPDSVVTHNNIGLTYYQSGKLDEAIESLKKSLQFMPDFFVAHSNLLFVMNCSSQITQKEIFAESLVFADKLAAVKDYREYSPLQNDTGGRKLRVGYISPDFRTHSVTFFFEPLLKAHNREKFAIYCYSDVKKTDRVTDRIRQEADHWRITAWKNDTDVITQIKNDKIDILVDLAGHTAYNRLSVFARKPAPIQVSWLGYPNTTGLEAMDYRFTDIIADPVDKDDEFYSEELIRLKDCFLCYQPFEHAPEVTKPPCVESGMITFGSFNNISKVTPEVIKVWSRILLSIPNSRLVLKYKPLIDERVRERFFAMFAEEGVSPDRIELLGKIPNKIDHLAAYSRIDIALDSFPYNGTTTTCEALWMGVPVITFSGDRHSGRVGASILSAIGMAEILVAENEESYIELAIALATEKDKLSGLRKKLRQQIKDSPLCNAVSFAQNIEEAYQIIWAKYIGIDVNK